MLHRTDELIEACRAREQASRDNVAAGREGASDAELVGLIICQQMDPGAQAVLCVYIPCRTYGRVGTFGYMH